MSAATIMAEDRLDVLRQSVEVKADRAVGPDITQGVVDGAEHAQPEQVQLDELHRLDVALVELDDHAAGHGGALERGDIDQRSPRHEHAADVDRQVPRAAVDAGTQLQPAVPRREAQRGATPARRQGVELDAAQAGGEEATLGRGLAGPLGALIQRGQGQAALGLMAQEALARRRVTGTTLVVGWPRAQVDDGSEVPQLAHVVEQLAHALASLGRLSEELGEPAIGLEITSHHHRVIRLERLGHAIDQRTRKAQRIAHLAHRRAGAVGDDVADHAGVLRAVAVVDVLDHLLAARRCEVDVDVGIGGATLVDEAFEEQLVADGVHAGDAERVGHDGVAGAAAALGGDAALAGEAHEVPADEEELGQAGALDDLQLVCHLLEGARRDGVVAPAHAVVAQALEIGERRFAAGYREAREAVALELQRHPAARRHLPRTLDAVEPGVAYQWIALMPRRQRGQLDDRS